VAGLLAAAEEERTRLAARREELSARIAAVRKELEDLPALEREASRLAGARESLDAARRWAEVALELREAEAALASSADVDPVPLLAAAEEARAALKDAEAAAHRAVAVREGAERDLAKAEAELAKAGELDASKPCPTCGQPLGDAFQEVVRHRDEEVATLRASLDEATVAVEKVEKSQAKAERSFEKASAKAEEARKASERRSALEDAAEKLRAKAARLAEPFAGEPPALDDLQARAARADEITERLASLRAQQSGLTQAESDLGSASAELEACLARITDLTERRDALSFSPERHAELRRRDAEARDAAEQAARDEREASDARKDAEREVASLASAIDQVKEARARAGELQEEARYADRVSLLLEGFRGHLYGRIIPELSREAEALFRELTNHEYEDLRIGEEDLSIQIADGGVYFPIERFSGSETDLANLALRAAISTHLSRMSGADLGMMVLDEVLASLDHERRDLMIQAMGRLSNRFHQLFVITHAEQVKDQFPASIEVRKVGRRRSQAVLV
jgi:DNA repair exonuclease SbcCD ATPase subunit